MNYLPPCNYCPRSGAGNASYLFGMVDSFVGWVPVVAAVAVAVAASVGSIAVASAPHSNSRSPFRSKIACYTLFNFLLNACFIVFSFPEKTKYRGDTLSQEMYLSKISLNWDSEGEITLQMNLIHWKAGPAVCHHLGNHLLIIFSWLFEILMKIKQSIEFSIVLYRLGFI